MTFEKSNYSNNHNYIYPDKSYLVEFLDFASSPWRELFGGKTICLLSETEESANKWNAILKITALFLLTYASPIVGGTLLVTSLIAFECKGLYIKYTDKEFEKINRQFKIIEHVREFEKNKQTPSSCSDSMESL